MPNVSAVVTTPQLHDFEFLAWIVRAGYLLRDDIYRQLMRLGVDESIALAFKYSSAVKERDLIQLYQDYGQFEQQAFTLFINDCWADYQRITNKLEKKGN
jgi:2-hydroxychromene-2-carboxylate isomerase